MCDEVGPWAQTQSTPEGTFSSAREQWEGHSKYMLVGCMVTAPPLTLLRAFESDLARVVPVATFALSPL